MLPCRLTPPLGKRCSSSRENLRPSQWPTIKRPLDAPRSTATKSDIWTSAARARRLRRLSIVEEEDGGGDGGGPAAVFVTDGGLGDVGGADDFVGDAIDFFFLVPAFVGVEVDVEGGGEHLGGEFLGVVSCLVFG